LPSVITERRLIRQALGRKKRFNIKELRQNDCKITIFLSFWGTIAS
jgi:hypothetical protein